MIESQEVELLKAALTESENKRNEIELENLAMLYAVKTACENEDFLSVNYSKALEWGNEIFRASKCSKEIYHQLVDDKKEAEWQLQILERSAAANLEMLRLYVPEEELPSKRGNGIILSHQKELAEKDDLIRRLENENTLSQHSELSLTIQNKELTIKIKELSKQLEKNK